MITYNPDYLKMARFALQRAEATMAPESLETLENRQVLDDIRMLTKALNPDYFALPDVFSEDFDDFPFDEAH